MAQPQLQIEGLGTLRRTLAHAGHRLEDMPAVNAAVAAVVIQAAAGIAPRRTGALAGSARPSKAKARARVLVGGARVPYAGPIHWGHPARSIQAQPWVSNAAVMTEDRWVSTYRRGVTDILGSVKGA